MAAIINPRDISLQATSPRLVPVTLPDNIIVPALKGIELTAPSSTFQVTTAGVASPTSILLTATLRQVTGTVVFSVMAGAATLTGTGNTRTLAYADAGSDSVTIRASVTENAIVYTSDLTIAKVRDGAAGAAGTNGTNGTRTAVLEMYRWSAAAPTLFPAGSSTYTWSTGQFTQPATLNSWSLVPPAAVAGQTLYVVRQVFADALTSSTSAVTWAASTSIPAGAAGTDGSNGTNGQRVGILEVYQWSAAAPTSYPSGTSTYTWATGVFTAPSTPNGWSLLPGAPVAGQTLWGLSVAVSDALVTSTSTASWTSSSVYAVGAAGAAGTNGANGVDGANGVNGTRQANLVMYQWSGAAPTLTPVGLSTYTWATSAFTAPAGSGNWALLPGVAGPDQSLYACAAPYSDSSVSSTSEVAWGLGQFTLPPVTNDWSRLPPTAVAQTLYLTRAITGDTPALNTLPRWRSAKVQSVGAFTAGNRVLVVEVFRWSATSPVTFPSGSIVYTWATGEFTLPATTNGWTAQPSAPVAGQTLYCLTQTHSNALATPTSTVTWTAATPTAIATAPASGNRTATLEMFKWSAATPTLFPSGTSVFTWAGETYTDPATANGWSQAIPPAVGGQTLWACRQVSTDALATSTTTVTWATATAYAAASAAATAVNGTRVSVLCMTKWSALSPTTFPSGASTYSWTAPVPYVVGAAGATGTRGSRQLYLVDVAYVSSYATYDSTATAAIATATAGSTPTTPIKGDTVTFSNGTDYTYTLTYSGSAWAPPGTVIDGSLLVTGSVSASKLTVGSVVTGSGGDTRVQVGNYGTVGSYTSSLSAVKILPSSNHILIAATNGSDGAVCIWGHNYSSGANGNGVSGSHSAAAALTSWSRIGILGSGTYGAAVAGITYAGSSGGYFEYRTGASNVVPGSPTNFVNLATGTHAIQATGAIASSGGLGVNGKAAQASAAVNAACTDLASAVALINQMRAALVANGICV